MPPGPDPWRRRTRSRSTPQNSARSTIRTRRGEASYACRVRVLVVDAANVMGSRPDGWWRDRGAAARRLRKQLLDAQLPHDEVVLVLEGAARRGHPAGVEGRVHTLHAPGSGDDAIVAAVTAQVGAGDGRSITVVTADRMLRARVEEAGALSVGPKWLLDRL